MDASSASRRRLATLQRQLVAQHVLSEHQIPYLTRAHGPFFTAAAVEALQPLELGSWRRWCPPVSSCACDSAPKVLDLSRGVAVSGHVEGEAAVGQWNDVRGPQPEHADAGLHGVVGIDLCAPVGTPTHAFADGEIFLVGY